MLGFARQHRSKLHEGYARVRRIVPKSLASLAKPPWPPGKSITVIRFSVWQARRSCAKGTALDVVPAASMTRVAATWRAEKSDELGMASTTHIPLFRPQKWDEPRM